MNDYRYEWRGNLIYISRFPNEVQPYTKSSAQAALDHVRRSKDWYVTEKAWQVQLMKFQVAVDMFEAEEKQCRGWMMWKLVRWYDDFRKRRRYPEEYKALRLAGFSKGTATWMVGSRMGRFLAHGEPWDTGQ